MEIEHFFVMYSEVLDFSTYGNEKFSNLTAEDEKKVE